MVPENATGLVLHSIEGTPITLEELVSHHQWTLLVFLRHLG